MSDRKETDGMEARARAELVDAIRTASEALGWSEDQVRSVIGAVTADDPDQLMVDIGEVLEWCRDIEAKATMVSLWKTLPVGVMEIQWAGTEPSCRIRPSCKVAETPEGFSIQLPERGTQ